MLKDNTLLIFQDLRQFLAGSRNEIFGLVCQDTILFLNDSGQFFLYRTNIPYFLY